MVLGVSLASQRIHPSELHVGTFSISYVCVCMHMVLGVHAHVYTQHTPLYSHIEVQGESTGESNACSDPLHP